MSPKTKISRQYFQRRPIRVSILQVKHPAHFVLKECISEPSSLEAKNFLEAEEAMQKYYGSLESDIYQLPLKDTVLVALVTKKFYRARVIKILLKTDGHHFRVYLLDYGRECEVTKDKLYSIHKDFLAHPYQAVEFKLLGLEPISLVINPLDLTFSSGPVEIWDTSAVSYIESLTKGIQIPNGKFFM
ncbi:putative ATP-dependent RNA helicase TDRD12 [Uloborus diversus]|uniref:putative ATP-dependent RNA helicase TDRD12 n=1 Tax=Uloborus diversus TaxID=327109 RepID=UPI00240A0161|nr:putative ATP-dependent RNA helicase TDRD12 [Uloborus diversus]